MRPPTARTLAAPNYNVAPTTTISTVVKRHTEPDDESTRRLRRMRWGLVPPWAKDGCRRRAGHQGPAADQRSRGEDHHIACVPKLGEEQALPCPDGRLVRMARWEKARKTPFYMYGGDGEPLFMAGLWSTWRPKARTEGQPATAELHDHHHRRRRPARRDPRPDAADDQQQRLGPLARPRRPGRRGSAARARRPRPIEIREVSRLVNSVRNNGPELIEPAEPEPEQATLL